MRTTDFPGGRRSWGRSLRSGCGGSPEFPRPASRGGGGGKRRVRGRLAGGAGGGCGAGARARAQAPRALATPHPPFGNLLPASGEKGLAVVTPVPSPPFRGRGALATPHPPFGDFSFRIISTTFFASALGIGIDST